MQARAQFKRRSTANNVEILVPVPEDADSPRFRTNIGSVHYAPEKSAIIWKIKQFGGGKEFLMRAELGLPSVKGDDEHGGGMTGGFGGSMGGAQGGKGKRPISVKFEIPYFTTSGIQVRYLKIIEPKVSCPRISFSLFARYFPCLCVTETSLARGWLRHVAIVGGHRSWPAYNGFMHVSLFGNRPRAGSMRWPRDHDLRYRLSKPLVSVRDVLTNRLV